MYMLCNTILYKLINYLNQCVLDTKNKNSMSIGNWLYLCVFQKRSILKIQIEMKTEQIMFLGSKRLDLSSEDTIFCV